MQSQVDDITRKLRLYAGMMNQNLDKFLDYAAVPVVQIGQAAAPMGHKIHYRYVSLLAGKGHRMSKGSGEIAATYVPGNLKGSVKTMRFSRSKNTVFVGPKIARGRTTGKFGPSRPDAYYAHMVEHGTVHSRAKPYMDKAAAQGLPLAYKRLETAARMQHQKFLAAHAR